MRKRIIPIVIAIAVVAVVGYYGWRYYQQFNGGAANALGGSGTIETEQIAITPQTTGRIVFAPPNEGVPVKTGDVLFRLDPSTAALTYAQAVAGERAALTNYKYINSHSSFTAADKANAKATYQQSVVAVQMTKVQLGYTIIRSPLNGTISSVIGNVGENALPGSNLAVISNPASLTVSIYIAENLIGQVHVGQMGTLTTDSTTKAYNCQVTFISTQAEFTPASIETKDQRVKLVYQVKLRVTDPDSALKAGMPADVVLK